MINWEWKCNFNSL